MAPPIDVHAHYTPPEWIAEVRRDGSAYGCRIEEDAAGRLTLRFGDGPPQALLPELSDLPARREALGARRLARQVLSPPMTIVGYGLAAGHGQALARLFNETNAATARGAGTAFIPVATVPMQDARAAVEELDYAVQSLGIRMVEIGTNVNGLNLDEERFAPFFNRAAALDVLVQLHPHQVAAQDRLRRYYLGNLVGNPVDTTIAAASLILGGVLDRLPTLKICLVHGGGTLPYLLGRMDHGYREVAASHTVPLPPETYLRRFYFDTLVHDPRALAFLHEMVGAEHLLFGTDYPYDMGESDPLGMLERAGLGSRAELLGDTAAALLGQSPAAD